MFARAVGSTIFSLGRLIGVKSWMEFIEDKINVGEQLVCRDKVMPITSNKCSSSCFVHKFDIWLRFLRLKLWNSFSVILIVQFGRDHCYCVDHSANRKLSNHLVSWLSAKLIKIHLFLFSKLIHFFNEIIRIKTSMTQIHILAALYEKVFRIKP